jgi:hypothetical protein
MNWFHFADKSINLNLVSEISWNYRDIGGMVTRVFFVQTSVSIPTDADTVYPCADIRSDSDRQRLAVEVGFDFKLIQTK